MEFENILKIILVGEPQVGKTSLRYSYMGKHFKVNYMPTIGCDFSIKKISSDHGNFHLHIWDLAGQEMFLEIRKIYYKGTSGVLLLFDLTRPETLLKIENWIDEISQTIDITKLKIIVIGNKKDLVVESATHIKFEDVISQIAYLNNKFNIKLEYIETSAKTGSNVQLAFSNIIAKLT